MTNSVGLSHAGRIAIKITVPVLSGRMYGVRPFHGPRLVCKLSSHELKNCQVSAPRYRSRSNRGPTQVQPVRVRGHPGVLGITLERATAEWTEESGAPHRVGRQGRAPGASAAAAAARSAVALMSIKANSVARRAEFIPCAWTVRCQLVCVARLLAGIAFVRNIRPGYRDHRNEVI